MKPASLHIAISGLLLLPALAHARKPKPPAAASKSMLKVISQGAAPRAELRYKLRPGKTTLRANVRMGMKIAGSKTRWTPVRMGMQVTFGKRLPTGLQPYTVRLLGFRVGGKALPAKARLMLQKTTLRGKVGPRGITAGVKLVSKNIPAALRQGLEQYRRCMSQSFVQLPKQPMGKGGVWEVRETKTLEFGGMKIRVGRVARYRIVRRRGSTLVLRVTTKTNAPIQTLKKGTITVKVHRLQGSSRGTHRIGLVRFKPHITLSSSSNTDIESGIRIAMQSLQRVKIRSK